MAGAFFVWELGGKDSKDFVILTKRGDQIWQKVNIA